MTNTVTMLVRCAGHRSFDRLYRHISIVPGAWKAVYMMQSGSLASVRLQFGAGSDGLRKKVAGQVLLLPANAADP